MLVRNEEFFVERALRNVVDFCDEMIVCDHGSRDRTGEILSRLASEYRGRVAIHRIAHPRESHELLRPFAGTATWMFGVDGDEIYDPAGLARFRDRLEAGQFDLWWAVFGNVLNVREFAPGRQSATGHLAPPCRSMTKLYNFSAVDDWDGDCVERLHGGRIHFKAGFHDQRRCDYHHSVDWEVSEFRCLHLCFQRRSAVDASSAVPRQNIMDRHAWSPRKVIAWLGAVMTGRRATDWKQQKYARGPLVTKDICAFGLE
jgi:hypothetical protein